MDYMRQPDQEASRGYGQAAAGYDAGLRAYMLRIYNYMAGALALTGLVSFFTANSQTMMLMIYGTPLFWLVALAPLVMVVVFAARVHAMSVRGARICFWSFAVLMGLSLASMFVVYTGASIARVFFITAAVFGTMSLFGYTTKRDLTSMGQFMFVGLIGVLLASLVNLFMQSSAVQFAVSIIAVVVFVGLTAYDTQKLKQMYYQIGGGGEMVEKVAIQGALSLYMDFLNLFLQLLHLMGNRR